MADWLKVAGIALAVVGLLVVGVLVFDDAGVTSSGIEHTEANPETTALVIMSLDAMTVSFAGQGQPYPDAWRTSDDQDIVDANEELISAAREAGMLIVYVYGDYDYWQEGQVVGAYPEDIAPQEGDIVLPRPYDIKDLLTDGSLVGALEEHGIERVLFSGVNTGFWVNRTAQYCLELDYEVCVVANAHSGGSPALAESYNTYWPSVGVTVIPICDVNP